MITLERLFEVHAAFALDKQLALDEMLGTASDWHFDMNTGLLTFGGRQRIPVQLIGTESESDASWLWIWGNSGARVPANLLKASEEVREFGRKNGVAELTTPEIPLAKASGVMLATIASGLCKADAYFRGAYPGGAMYFLLQAPQVREFSSSSAQHVANVFVQLISASQVHHRSAFQYYLHYKSYKAHATDEAVIATSSNGEKVEAQFDAQGRLVRIAAAVRKIAES